MTNRCRICGRAAGARVDDLLTFDLCQECADNPEREIAPVSEEPGPVPGQLSPISLRPDRGAGLPGYAIYREDRITGEVEPDWPTAADWYGYE